MKNFVRSWAIADFAVFAAKTSPENKRPPVNGFFIGPVFLRQSLVLVVLGIGLTGSAATAGTVYDFSFSGSGGVSITGGSLTVDQNIITSISGVVSGSNADGNINGLVTETAWFSYNDNLFFYPANPGYFPQQTSVAFYTGSFPSPANGGLQSNAFNLMYSSGSYYLTDGADELNSIGSMSAVPAGGGSVPEIDPATGSSALSLVAGVLALVEQRRRRGLKAG